MQHLHILTVLIQITHHILLVNKSVRHFVFLQLLVFLAFHYYLNDLELLSERTGLEKNLVKDLLSISQDMVNLDSSIKSDDDSSSTFSEFIEDPTAGPEAEVVDESLRTEVRSLLLTLSDKERTILSMRYGLDGQKPMSLKEIGLEFGLTKERIRQIEKRALEKLRDNSQGRALECYTVA